MKRIELLSPVGNKDMLYQAIHNGADAVYLAGVNYGARKYSNNFTNDELVEAIKYSHLYGVKVYVTVNTIIYENEINDFIKYIEFLYVNGVDALIIQDIGMISMIRKRFPDIELHASTQCHNHNKEGIQLLKELGCSRVVMAREMSLDEINNLDVDIEKEVFVYGALCVCYSGCCLFSSLNGGRSGNRGECVGSCRLPYKLIQDDKEVLLKDKYLLSTKDLNTLSKLKDILDSNIDSLKIEGRMKSPVYVGYVTRLYRLLIDKYYNHEDMVLTDGEIINLKKIFNREFTEGYLFKSKDIMNIKTPNHQGIEIGKVISANKKFITIELKDYLSQNDGIRFKNADKGMIVNKLYNKKFLLVNSVDKFNICMIPNKIGLRDKDVVLKTIDYKLENDISNYIEKKIDISFKINLSIGKSMKLEVSDGANELVVEGSVVEKAKTREVNVSDIEKALLKLGNTPYNLIKLEINKDDNIFVNLKDINILRRMAVDRLNNKRMRRDIDIKINNNYEEIFVEKDNLYYINALVRNEEQLKCCIDNDINNIYVSDYDLYNKYKNYNNIYYRVSRVNSDYIDFNNSNLLVGELGSVYKYKDNNNIVGDYYLNVANSKGIKLLNSLGVNRVTLSVELSDDKIKDIMNNNYNVELIIYGRLELMVTKYCPLKKCLNYCDKCKNSKDKFYFEDRLGKRYPIIHDKCITHIMHNSNINNIDNINYYKELGINNYRLEFFDENYNEVKRYIQKVKNML
ncbi:MAG: DUF3656 domain-containing protein [Bacilli bacterium]|nr:DUF3656 domain-containing protein [Bacilli bacterium]